MLASLQLENLNEDLSRTIELSGRHREGLTAKERNIGIARDPVAAAEFFNVICEGVLKDLVGVRAHNDCIPGVFGNARAYLGVAEA